MVKNTIYAYGYARYSSNNQREESIIAQKNAINDYCSKHNIIVERWFVDEAQSARTDDRVAFQEMIRECEKKENKHIQMVIVHKRDRFARDRYDMAYYKRKLAQLEIRIMSVVESHLDGSPESIMLESILDGMSEYYSKNLSREVLKGAKVNILSKRTAGSTPPLGLKVNPDTLRFEIDEPNAEAIRILFHRFVYDRWSYRQICDELNEKGYRTSRGNKFSSKGGLIDLLNNEKYYGRLTYLKSRTNSETRKRSSKRNYDPDSILAVDDAIPPIIDKETWDKAQEILKKRKKCIRTVSNEHKINLLVGKIYCGECGCLMSIKTRKSGKGHVYSTYCCSGKHEKTDRKCKSHEISVIHVERYVVTQLMYFLNREETISELLTYVNKYYSEENEAYNNELKSMERKLAGIDVKINNIIEAIANGNTYDALLNKLQVLESDKKELEEKKIESLNHQPVLNTINENELKCLLKKAKDYMLSESDEAIRAVLDTFVDNVKVFDERVEITYYLHSFHFVYYNWKIKTIARDVLLNNKGLDVKVLKGRWYKNALIRLNESKPPIHKIIKLVI